MKLPDKIKHLQVFSSKTFIYATHITLACVFTAELNIIHAHFLLGMQLTYISFIMPTFAGVLFGYLLARVKLLGEQLKEIAYTDSLTNIYNRLHFNRLLDAEMDKAKRYGGQLSLIFFDIDHFKQINDTHGHPTGDIVLKEIATVISEANRSSDVFARYGGEEFIILTASTNIKGAMEHAQRLKQDIEQHRFPIGRVTASFGVTEFNAASDDQKSLLERADKALYQAKSDGRNCVRQL
ncbi:MAG: GGDEF domain-containing protein [Gammaproteobacteria bacterium]|nr:GGDEF domain-containing protein [Gammaproteobacteria bacterium]